ncbi:MAG: ParB N-terminal domain-containing protein [Thermoanaerobaculia bacterium]
MPPRKRRKAAESASRGLTARETAEDSPPAKIAALRESIVEDGGSVLATFRDPLGGHWQILAALPVERVEPTPFQRDLSETHVTRLARVVDSLGRYLDPIIAVRTEAARYWTPNGNHRLSAMRRLGARAIVALVLPDPEVAYKILALNTEKAHNLREKALEVIRMARELAGRDAAPERQYALEFEEAALLTLGICYEKNGRFAGGAYHPLLKRLDEFSSEPLARALRAREGRAARVMELEEAVSAAVEGLKERGFESPYLRAFVVARINPLRFHKGEKPSFDATLEKMIAAARKFKPDSVKAEQVARAAGPPEETA